MKSSMFVPLPALALAAALSATAADAQEVKANQLFGAASGPTSESPAAIGSYAKGCMAGGIQLEETGPTWQAMRLNRNRNWGHPVLVDFIKDLSAEAVEAGWKGLYVGDMSQPRGGPMTSGHQSHQIGLDVDIWMLPPESLSLSRERREEISSISVRTEDQRDVNGNWSDSHMRILKAAASDPRVDRIFVAAAAKVRMCSLAGSDRMWLQRIRPYYGHNYHFHVRLKCPEGAADCVTQTPTVAELTKGGDGCDDTLQWWVTAYPDWLEKPKDPEADPPPKKRGARDYVMADLPGRCQEVLGAQ